MQQYRAPEPLRRFKQHKEPLVVERETVHIREHLHTERAEVAHSAFELGYALIAIIQRERRDESREAVRISANQSGHRVVRKPGQVESDLPVGVDGLDWR